MKSKDNSIVKFYLKAKLNLTEKADFQYKLALSEIENLNKLLVKYSNQETNDMIKRYNDFLRSYIEKAPIDTNGISQFLNSLPTIFNLDKKDNYDSYLIVIDLKKAINQIIIFLREYDNYTYNKNLSIIDKQYTTLNFLELYFDYNSILFLDEKNNLRYFRGNIEFINEYFGKYLFVKSKTFYISKFIESIRLKKIIKFNQEEDILKLLKDYEKIYGSIITYKLIEDSITKDFKGDDSYKTKKIYDLLVDVFQITASFDEFLNFAINGSPITLESNIFSYTKSMFDTLVYNLFIRNIIQVNTFVANGKDRLKIQKSLKNFNNIKDNKLIKAFNIYNERLNNIID